MAAGSCWQPARRAVPKSTGFDPVRGWVRWQNPACRWLRRAVQRHGWARTAEPLPPALLTGREGIGGGDHGDDGAGGCGMSALLTMLADAWLQPTLVALVPLLPLLAAAAIVPRLLAAGDPVALAEVAAQDAEEIATAAIARGAALGSAVPAGARPSPRFVAAPWGLWR